MNSQKKSYTITIKPLTGVHVGSGQELNPLDYKIGELSLKNGSKKNLYMKFSADKILDNLIKTNNAVELDKFEKLNSSVNFREMQKFFQRLCNFDLMDYPCDVTKEFLSLYRSKLQDDGWENELKVFQQYHPEGKASAVIPGSSIKGSIRTAILNYILLKEMDDEAYEKLLNFAEEEKAKDRNKKGSYETDIQNTALKIDGKKNDVKSDPFRCVEVSDCKVLSKYQLVGCMKNGKINKHSNELDVLNMQMIAEIIPGSLLNYSTEASFDLRINESLQNSVLINDDKAKAFKINRKISMQEIIKACNYFYKAKFLDEYEKFYSYASEGMDVITNLLKIVKNIDEQTDQFIIRVGRWSQGEFVTFGNDFRNPKTRVIKGKEMGFGETRTVFNYDGQYVPMGWCLCTVKEN